MEISKELLSEVLGCTETNYEILAEEKLIYIKGNYLHYEYQDPYCSPETYITIKSSINSYELVHLKLKQWAKLENFFDKIEWSEEAEVIIKKAEELRNQINEK